MNKGTSDRWTIDEFRRPTFDRQALNVFITKKSQIKLSATTVGSYRCRTGVKRTHVGLYDQMETCSPHG